jgi:hypothetical protein
MTSEGENTGPLFDEPVALNGAKRCHKWSDKARLVGPNELIGGS